MGWRLPVHLALDVKAILMPPSCILHQRFSLQHTRGRARLTAASTPRCIAVNSSLHVASEPVESNPWMSAPIALGQTLGGEPETAESVAAVALDAKVVLSF